MRARLTALVTALGLTAALGVAATAHAATTPTISVPASRQGYGPITITGTATPGATVELYESAYVFNDFYASPDYSNGGYITTTATSAGRYTLTRIIDSGFRFYVQVDGVASPHVSVAMGIVGTLKISGNTATVAADPAQPYLNVHLQRANGTAWTTVSSGYTSDAGTYSAALTSQGTYRAVIDADTDNNLRAGTSASVTYGSSSTGSPAVKAGAIQFTQAQYNSPGADNRSNTSLNQEWVRLTNKTKATINLKNWTVRNAAGTTYKFTTTYNLGAGKTVYLHTGKATNTSTHRYWNRTGYAWNNTKDTATLRSSTGAVIDTCKWNSTKGVTSC